MLSPLINVDMSTFGPDDDETSPPIRALGPAILRCIGGCIGGCIGRCDAGCAAAARGSIRGGDMGIAPGPGRSPLREGAPLFDKW